MKFFLTSLLAVAAFFALPMSVAASEIPDLSIEDPGALPQKWSSDVYIVQMRDAPVLSYDGSLRGLRATKPGKGRRLNPNAAHVRKYVAHLDDRHEAALAAVGAGRRDKIYDYRYALNGFAAELSSQQVDALRNRDDVVQVWRDELQRPTTDTTHDYLGLSTPGGVWATSGQGENVIVGVIDTGIWPEHDSFSDQIDLADRPGRSGKRTLDYDSPPAHWNGTCQSGENFSQDDCNNKLIGARHFHSGFGRGHSGILVEEYLSPRDRNGHGSHTASTIAGNAVPTNSVNGNAVRGVAPRARIAAYKVCWTDRSGQSGCASSDSAAAIDAAVADGVDVINFSIGGPSTVFAGPDDIAFLLAADAGVWVATSNGNDGPGAGTVGTPSGVPWLTSVGATQDDQVFYLGLETSGNLDGLFEAVEGTGPVQFTDDLQADLVPASPLEACGDLDNDLTGQIALVIRGTCAFSDKYNNAAAAGAIAIVVYNDGTDPSRIDPIAMAAPDTTIPGAMIGFHDGEAIVDESPGVAGAIGPGSQISADNRIASFSSRGPNVGAPDVIKPDVAAPGVDILAAGPGEQSIVLSGTSMSSPHVAGLFALLKEAHPDWSPAMARSALMTSARQNLKKSFGDDPADPFDIGAGHVVPAAAFEPGLVYDAGLPDYLAFTCGNNVQLVTDATCSQLASAGFPSDGSDLNLPSIGIADLVGTQTVTREVTSVIPGSHSFSASVDAPNGIDVTVSPQYLHLEEGESGKFDVSFTATSDAIAGDWVFGALTWEADGSAASPVRSPIAVRPSQLDAPAEVSGSGPAGSLSFPVQFGYTGAYTAGAHGLVAAMVEDGTVDDDPGNSFQFFGPGTTLHTVELTGAEVARWALFNEHTDGDDDLDLYVFHCPGGLCSLVGSSGNPDANEQVTLSNPADGLYAIFVHGWETDGGDANYSLFGWAPGAEEDNLTVNGPGAAEVGTVGTVQVDWSDLEAGEKYLGSASHRDADGVIQQTVISISTE